MNLTIDQRVSIARELLRGFPESEYENLSCERKVNLQEAIEFLEYFQETEQGNGSRP